MIDSIPEHLNIPEVSDYLNMKGQIYLASNYKSDGGCRLACEYVAIQVAQRLLRHNLSPRFDELRPVTDISASSHPRLIPLVFEGRVDWAWHVICCIDDVVYDPVARRPVIYENYQQIMFDVPIIRSVSYREEELAEIMKDIYGIWNDLTD